MNNQALNLDWLIAVDDHVLEPPHVWVDRVAAKDRDRAPHMEFDDNLDYWVYDGKRYPSSGLSAVAGKSKEEFSPEALPYSEMRPGCYHAKARLREHVFGCFIDDAHGIASIDEIGEDNIMCETDYPHSASTWPTCIQAVREQISHLPEATQYKILRGNAERLYRFTPAAPPVLAHA